MTADAPHPPGSPDAGEPAAAPADPVPAEVREEEALCQQVQAVLRRRVAGPATRYDREILDLGEALGEERQLDDQAALIEQMDRLAALSARQRARVDEVVDPHNPYFAHLRLRPQGGEVRDILLGKRTFLRDGVRIVDWRNAPVSRVFYQCAEGEEYEEVFAGREVSGDVLARRTVTLLEGRLVRVGTPRATFLRTREGWREVADAARTLAGGAGRAMRPDTSGPLLGGGADLQPLSADKRLPEIASLLDAEQFDLLTRPGQGLLLIQGSAGSGKTTVGLHRLAFLEYHEPERFRAHRMVVVVFTAALKRYISQVLPALGVDGVPVRTLAEWASSLRNRHLPRLTRHVSRDTPAVVVRFKSHRLLLPALAEAARAARQAPPPQLFDELFTDRGWLEQVVARFAPGDFSADDLDEVHRWCTRLCFWRTDGGGPNVDDLPAYDPEDDMILLRLQQLLRGPLRHKGKKRLRYDHLMVDEAQDFSPLELKVLLDTVRDESATLAGDVAQRIVEGKGASDWTEVLTALDQGSVAVAPLKISYRSTREIATVGRHVLGPLAPSEPLRTVRSGAPVELFRCAGAGEALTFLADALRDLEAREPQAGVAVLTRFGDQAGEAYRALKRADLPGLRRVADQDFVFAPGIEVTDIAQTKGLEFDYVVLLGVDDESFPINELARHLLHVGITRAVHQLWLFCWGTPSPLLPDDLPQRIAG